MTFEDFYNQYNGKPVEKEDPTALDQCMDLIFAWVDALQVPRETVRHPVAYQVWTIPTALTNQYFTLIPNTPTGIPQKGDIIVFGTNVGPSGHVCIANGTGDTNTFKSFDQNWNGHRFATTETHDYNGCMGWLRLKNTTDWQAKYNQLLAYVKQIQGIVNQVGA